MFCNRRLHKEKIIKWQIILVTEDHETAANFFDRRQVFYTFPFRTYDGKFIVESDAADIILFRELPAYGQRGEYDRRR
jgi:hypothetical protein